MKKVISAILAGAMCAGAFTACGDKKDDKKSGGLSTKCNGEYVSIRPFDGNREVFEDSIDEGIEYSMDLAEEYEKENDDEYNPHLFKFSGDEFLIPIWNANSIYHLYYDGTFSVKNGKIKFSYENYLNPKLDFKANINDEVEIDNEILSRTSEKLEGLSSEEKKELIKEEQDKQVIQNTVETMQQLNETGSYYDYVAPAMNYNDKWADFSVLPFIRRIVPYGGINTDYPNTLYAVDDFLCTETYGIELDGKYKKGKDFTLKHDLEDTIENDEQSPYKDTDDAEELIDKALERAERDYDCDDVETTIEFSDGEWEWFNADGGLINNGKYDESKDYPGLIMMSLDEDSKNCPDYAITSPLWFYITDDGEIYYPGYVKMD
ncbi:MAG: hypothetical protein IKK47_00860 [Ruminococcus sp.]|nr:hypothetical protein [Ruminococcus sp.]